jgi:hypothetical protein
MVTTSTGNQNCARLAREMLFSSPNYNEKKEASTHMSLKMQPCVLKMACLITLEIKLTSEGSGHITIVVPGPCICAVGSVANVH